MMTTMTITTTVTMMIIEVWQKREVGEEVEKLSGKMKLEEYTCRKSTVGCI